MFGEEEIYRLLCEEYTLELVTTDRQTEAVKEIRETVYTQKYGKDRAFLDTIGVIYNHEDDQSFIYLLKHLPTRRYVGTVRSYFVNRHTPPAPLPMNQTVDPAETAAFLNDLPLVEISRLALFKQLPPHPDYSVLKLHTLLTLGLFLAVRITVTVYPVHTLLSIMEPALQRILKRRNILFEPIAEPVDSYGTLRVPYFAKTACAFRATEAEMGKTTRYYIDRFCRDGSFDTFIDRSSYLHKEETLLDTLCETPLEGMSDTQLFALTGYDREPCR